MSSVEENQPSVADLVSGNVIFPFLFSSLCIRVISRSFGIHYKSDGKIYTQFQYYASILDHRYYNLKVLVNSNIPGLHNKQRLVGEHYIISGRFDGYYNIRDQDNKPVGLPQFFYVITNEKEIESTEYSKYYPPHTAFLSRLLSGYINLSIFPFKVISMLVQVNSYCVNIPKVVESETYEILYNQAQFHVTILDGPFKGFDMVVMKKCKSLTRDPMNGVVLNIGARIKITGEVLYNSLPSIENVSGLGDSLDHDAGDRISPGYYSLDAMKIDICS